jgi:hypothetical protein
MNLYDHQFHQLLNLLGIDQINEILFNWNESELNEDGTEILIFVDSRSNGPRSGGADFVEKREFIEWLLSDAPYNEEVYGANIREDEHWARLIDEARNIISK